MLRHYRDRGWEPVRHGWADRPGIGVERLGRIGKDLPASIAFTVRDLAESGRLDYVLTLDARALGLGRGRW